MGIVALMILSFMVGLAVGLVLFGSMDEEDKK